MKNGISPFTRTPGIAGNALIKTHFSDEIIMNFESNESFKYVYKIVGLRGSGKSVEYSIVMNHFRAQKKWLVYALSAGGDPLQTLISRLSEEHFIDDKVRNESFGTNASASGNIALVSANANINSSVSISDNEHYYSPENELRVMLRKAKQKGYKVLIGVDDIAKTDEMIRFLSTLGMILMEQDYDVRFICTGLSRNIADFVNVPHLSFFVRNESIKMKPLDNHEMTAKYRKLLGVTHDEAVALAQFTKGYAYGYQVLGELCFQMDKAQIDSDLEDAFDETIGSQYDLLWSTLTDSEQKLVKIILDTESGQIAEIKSKMKKSSGFTSLRDRLLKKHILIAEKRGTVAIPLPRFKQYVDTWHS